VVVYGIASSLSHDVADFYDTREEAEAALAQVFRESRWTSAVDRGRTEHRRDRGYSWRRCLK
jgi:hypothetical protein